MKTSTKVLGIALLSLLSLGKLSAQVASFTWSPNSPCPGQTVQITSTSTGTTGTTHGYSVSGATSATYAVPNPVVTFTASGTQTITLVLFTGTVPVSSSASVVIVKTAPVYTIASSPTMACNFNTVALSTTVTPAGSTYSWAAPASGTNATSTGTMGGSSAGQVFTVVITGSNACTASAMVTVAATPGPSVTLSSSANTVCVGSNATFTASGAATGYTWTGPTPSTVSIGSGSTISITASTVAATYTYVVFASGTVCPNVFYPNGFLLTVSGCVGINELTGNVSFGVYPNPTTGEFTIELANGAAKTIEVMDLTGRVVLTNTTSLDKVTVDVSTLAKGIYYVRVQSNNTIEVAKIVVQ